MSTSSRQLERKDDLPKREDPSRALRDYAQTLQGAPGQPSDRPTPLATEKPDRLASDKPEPFKENRMTKRDGLSAAEKSDGVSYSWDAQYKDRIVEGKYGFNADGKFVRFDDGQNHIYRNLSTDDLKALNKSGQPGWYLMGEKGPQKLKSDDVRFVQPDAKGDGGIFIARRSDTLAYAWDQNGTKHEGKVTATHAFVESDQFKNPTWIVRADGSQVKGEYAYGEQKPGQKPPLKSLTEISANGEKLTLVRDETNKDRLVKLGGNGEVLEERYKSVLDASGTSYSDNKDGVSTIILGDSTVEHGHIMFGDSNAALRYRAYRKQPNAVHLEPATYPTFCVDREGRTAAVLAPEKGGKPGCNDSTNGGVDRFFTYIGNTSKLSDMAEIDSKGSFADLTFHTTRYNEPGKPYGESDKWAVQKPVMTDVKTYSYKNDDEGNPLRDRYGRPVIDREEDGTPITKTEKRASYTKFDYNGPLDFAAGTRDILWNEKIGPQGKQFDVACLNHPDGSIDRMHRIHYRENDKPDGKILHSVDRYLDSNLTPIALQHRDANGNPIGDKFTATSHPGADLNLNGSVTFTDSEQNQHHILPGGREAILNPTDWTYVQKDSSGRPIRAGQLNAAGKMDENNCLTFSYAANSEDIRADKITNGNSETISNGPGAVSPAGALWHEVRTASGKTMIAVEQPDLSTLYKNPDQNDALTQVSASSGAFSIDRKMSEGQDPTQPDRIVDTLTDKNTGDVYHRELVGVNPDKAVENGLPPQPVRQYYMTLKKVPAGQDAEKAPYLVPPPSKPGEAPQSGRPQILIALEVLGNGDVQGTDVNTLQQKTLPTPRSPEQFRDYVMPDHIHLARAKERFDAVIKKELHAQNEPNSQLSGPQGAWSRLDHMAINNPNAPTPFAAEAAQVMLSHDLPPALLAFGQGGRPLPTGPAAGQLAAQLDYATARIMADRNQPVAWTKRLQGMQSASLDRSAQATPTPTTQPPTQQSTANSQSGVSLGSVLRFFLLR